MIDGEASSFILQSVVAERAHGWHENHELYVYILLVLGRMTQGGRPELSLLYKERQRSLWSCNWKNKETNRKHSSFEEGPPGPWGLQACGMHKTTGLSGGLGKRHRELSSMRGCRRETSTHTSHAACGVTIRVKCVRRKGALLPGAPSSVSAGPEWARSLAGYSR